MSLLTPSFLRSGLGMAGSFLVALAGAQLWQLLHLPLPWLVGSLYSVALARVAGLPLVAPPAVRQCGQWVIGINMGLYFTPLVLAELLAHAGLIVGMAFVSLAMGLIGAAVLVRLRLADSATAFFSSMPGGASEMANQSDIWNAAVDRVAAAHAMRVMLVVLIVPLALAVSHSHGEAAAAVARTIVWSNLALLAAAGLGGAAVFLWLRLPNAWVLGTMSAVAALSIGGQALSALPPWLSAGGQLFIGVALGSRFGPGFLRKAPSFLAAIAVMSLLFLLATGLLSYLLALLTGLPVAGLILSFSPGGIAEMSITASHLNLGVPLVVASHVSRVVMLTLFSPLIFKRFLHRFGR
jgi:membrane AbrB-like protein